MIATLLLAIVPCSLVLTDRVEVIELAHQYDGRGRHLFSQWVFWRDGYVTAWRMAEGNRRRPTDDESAEYRRAWGEHLAAMSTRAEYIRDRQTANSGRVIPRDSPRIDAPPFVAEYGGDYPSRRGNGDWVLILHDRGELRRVVAPVYRQSWLQQDIEVLDRRRLPEDKRRGLVRRRGR